MIMYQNLKKNATKSKEVPQLSFSNCILTYKNISINKTHTM